MILDCSEMEVPVAMIHVVGTMLYPTDNDQRRAWITWGLMKMFQRIEYKLNYSSDEEMYETHRHLGANIGLLALNFGGLSTFIQNIYADRDIYSVNTNNERAQIGLRSGNILNTALSNKESIAASTQRIHRALELQCHRDGSSNKVYKPRSEEKSTWNKFRSVSHLWAAANTHWRATESLHEIHLVGELALLFVPEEQILTELSDRFDDFLNTADRIRSQATSPALGMCKSNKPILDSDSAWDVIVPGIRNNDLMVSFMKGMPF